MICTLKNSGLVPKPWSNQTTIEHLAEGLCGISAVLFTFIATFSRSTRGTFGAEHRLHVTSDCRCSRLWWLSLSGGDLWGSNYLPKPLSLVCIVSQFQPE